LGGLLVAAVVKYTDNILKAFATSAALVGISVRATFSLTNTWQSRHFAYRENYEAYLVFPTIFEIMSIRW
jgi:hypothetical protein